MNISRMLTKGHTFTLLLVIAAGVFFNWALNGPLNPFSVVAVAIMIDLVATLVGHSLGRTSAWHGIAAGEDYGRIVHRRDVARARVDIDKHLTPVEREQLTVLEDKIDAAYRAADDSHDATPSA